MPTRKSTIARTPVDVGHWIADGGNLLPLGRDYLFCILLFYAVLPVYVIRNLAMALLLRDIAVKAQLNILPLHPDHAGGLLPIGRLGLRNQYALSLFGLNIILLLITYSVLGQSSLLIGLNVLATLAYLLLGPFVFIAPLMPFREGMLKAKMRVMADVGLWLRGELDKLNERLESGQITKDDEELVERARKIGALAEDVPVWPFDAATVRRFLAAYALPLAGSVSLLALKAAASLFNLKLPGG